MAIEIRPVSGMEDLERWVALHNQIRPHDPATADAKALVRALQTERADLLAYLDGVPVGNAVLTGDTQSRESGRPYVLFGVLPAYRGRGVGDALLRAASDHARRLGRTELSSDADADDTYSLAFLHRRGFVEYRRWEELKLELDTYEAPTPHPPEAVEIASVTERPGLLEGMHRVAVEVYPALGGHVGRSAESFVDWQVHTLGGPEALLHLALIGVAGDEVVGFATAMEVDATTAELRMVAVLPDWRGRGVGTALVAAQLARAKHTRSGRLIAWVPAGAAPGHVFRGLGFEQVRGVVEMRGPLLS